ncbi:MAG TPA: serine hydrolase domain-containing protein, partial [Oleiagrimonas sp.]|nr:serine hydrolase domain-containing protein [Oleiagrimonas sp.]
MRLSLHLRLCGVIAGLGLSLPLLATPAGTATTAGTPQSVGQQREDVLFWSQARRDRDFSRLYKIFPADRVAHGMQVHALPEGKPLRPQWQDASITLSGYMQRYHIAGVMVLQNGRIRLQRYAANFGPSMRWTSFSVAKSVTSVLLGIALKQGYVHSLDDTLVIYIPQLAGSAYADVTVRQLLTMT